MEKQINSKSGKEYVKAVYSHPAYLLYAEYIMRNAGLDEAKAGIKIARKNIKSLDKQMTPYLWQKAKKTKEPLDESERRE